MSEVVHIHYPFLTAGRRYGWLGEYHRQIGLGLRVELFQGEGKVRVTVGKTLHTWVIDKQRGREIAAKYKAYYYAPGEVKLLVLPWEAFTKEGGAA